MGFCWSGRGAPRLHALWVFVTKSCVDRCACEYIPCQERVNAACLPAPLALLANVPGVAVNRVRGWRREAGQGRGRGMGPGRGGSGLWTAAASGVALAQCSDALKFWPSTISLFSGSSVHPMTLYSGCF